MSKFPSVSGNQMTKYLQSKGFAITKRRGSHVTLRYKNIFTVIPLGSKRLKIRTQFSILLYAGISKEEFVNDYDSGLVA